MQREYICFNEKPVALEKLDEITNNIRLNSPLYELLK